MIDITKLQKGDNIVDTSSNPVKKVYNVKDVDTTKNLVTVVDPTTQEEVAIDAEKDKDKYTKTQASYSFEWTDEEYMLAKLAADEDILQLSSDDLKEVSDSKEPNIKFDNEYDKYDIQIDSSSILGNDIKEIIKKNPYLNKLTKTNRQFVTFYGDESLTNKFLTAIENTKSKLEKYISIVREEGNAKKKQVLEKIQFLKVKQQEFLAFNPSVATDEEIHVFLAHVGSLSEQVPLSQKLKEYLYAKTPEGSKPLTNVEETKIRELYIQENQEKLQKRIEREKEKHQLKIQKVEEEINSLQQQLQQNLTLAEKLRIKNQIAKLQVERDRLKVFKIDPAILQELENLQVKEYENPEITKVFKDRTQLFMLQKQVLNDISFYLQRSQIGLEKLDQLVLGSGSESLITYLQELLNYVEEKDLQIRLLIQEGLDKSFEKYKEEDIVLLAPIALIRQNLVDKLRKLLAGISSRVNKQYAQSEAQELSEAIGVLTSILDKHNVNSGIKGKSKRTIGDTYYENLYDFTSTLSKELKALNEYITKIIADIAKSSTLIKVSYLRDIQRSVIEEQKVWQGWRSRIKSIFSNLDHVNASSSSNILKVGNLLLDIIIDDGTDIGSFVKELNNLSFKLQSIEKHGSTMLGLHFQHDEEDGSQYHCIVLAQENIEV